MESRRVPPWAHYSLYFIYQRSPWTYSCSNKVPPFLWWCQTVKKNTPNSWLHPLTTSAHHRVAVVYSWQLSLSILKCIVLHLGRANPHFCYRLSDTPLSSQQYVRDLGVTVSSDLTYHKHIVSIVSAATKKIYLILRCFHSKDVSVLRRIFISFFGPSLEYASNIWSPWSNSEINCLEKI